MSRKPIMSTYLLKIQTFLSSKKSHISICLSTFILKLCIMGTTIRFQWLNSSGDYPDKQISYNISLMPQYTTTSGGVTSHCHVEGLKRVYRKVSVMPKTPYIQRFLRQTRGSLYGFSEAYKSVSRSATSITPHSGHKVTQNQSNRCFILALICL